MFVKNKKAPYFPPKFGSKFNTNKVSGFCDIVKEAALKKEKKPVGRKEKTATKSATTVAATSPVKKTTKCVNKWEEFREKKLIDMKRHKFNVERRMKTSCNIDSQMYWSQRTDKLKRYPKHEALHPSWYTDNIYSNQSVDLENDDLFSNNEKFDDFYPHHFYGLNDYDRDLFQHKKTHVKHIDIDTGYSYPKSRSCCFGSGYDERPKPILMPKSNSFVATVSRGVNNIQSVLSTVEEEKFLRLRRHHNNRNDTNQISLRKLYCWENERQHSLEKDEMIVSEMRQVAESERNTYKKPNIDILDATHSPVNANCIRNIWHNSMRDSTSYKINNDNINLNNDNGLDEYSVGPFEMSDKKLIRRESEFHLPLDEEYLIINRNQEHSSRRESNESQISMNYHSNVVNDQLLDFNDNENMKLLNIDDDVDDSTNQFYSNNNFSRHVRCRHKSKSMLEVKPPNRYDDSSSDSTDLDLDDFNFDFEKYWNELDKTTNKRMSTTSSMANHQYSDYRNNNCTANIFNKSHSYNANFKEKNTNFDNYAQKMHRPSIDTDVNDIMDIGDDITDNEDFDNDDIKNDRSDIEMDATNDIYNFSSQNTQHDYKNTFYDSLTSPTHRNRLRYQQSQLPLSDKYKNNMIGTRFNDNDYLRTLYDDSQLVEHLHSHNPQQNYDNSTEYYPNTSNNSQNIIDRCGNNNNHINNINDNCNIINNDTDRVNESSQAPNKNGAISLLNIFSIYKPRKYSPVNCRSASQKVSGVSKNMNVPSTVRPLGAPYNDFLTSMKRPLTITPSCFTTIKHTWPNPASSVVDQPHFKIIPEKTGLKISPLYRFGYEDDSKLRLKCTARPLLFPL